MEHQTVSALPRRLPISGSWTSLAPDVRAALLVAAAYYAGSFVGFSLRFPSSGIAYIWPPNAILLAALLLLKTRTWPAALAGAFLAHAAAHTQDGVPIPAWVWQFVGNAGQAALAAALVLRFSGRPRRYDTLRSVAVFIAGAAIVAPALASLLPAYAYGRMGWASDFWTAWQMRTLTNIVTTVTLVPPLVTVLGEHRLRERVTPSGAAEFVTLLFGVVASDVVAFAIPHTTLSGLPMAFTLSMPFLAWAAARFGAPGLSICLLAVAHLSIKHSADPSLPAGVSAGQLIMGVQLFVGITASPFMFLSAALGESEHSRRAETALHRSEARNAAILRALPDLMFVLTKDDHRYVDFYCSNPDDLLVRPEQFLGKRMREVFPPEFSSTFEAAFARVCATGEPQMVEYSLAIHGEPRFFEARAVACDNDTLLSIVRDITERRRAEAALREAQQTVARISRAGDLGELAASIAHEVRQPLSAIGANAAACLHWLEQDAADSRQIEAALADIMRDVGRAGDVVKRTRELFGSGARENTPVDLNAAIAEMLALLRHRVDSQAECIRTELAPAPLWVRGDRIQLQQVLFNLVTNALQATNRPGASSTPVLVRSWSVDGTVHVAVRDEGPGFDPHDRDRIFEPFFTTKQDGLGVGLSISRSIIQAHGGALEATLNADRGATFEFRLPAVPAPAAGARPLDAA